MIIVLLLIIIFSTLVWIEYDIDKTRSKYQQDFTLSGEGILVLNYHRIRYSSPLVKVLDKSTMFYTKDAELLLYSVYKDEFKEQIMYLIKNGFHFITPDELKKYINNELSFPQKSALITFDDVDISVYENAFPFLLENQIPFTLFIITGEVGNPDFKGLQLATWDQIIEMKESGLATIGTHTHKMHYLDKKLNPPFLNNSNMADFKQDTQLTIGTVEEKLGIVPLYYAYPYGFGMPETDDIVLKAGYELIFTLKPGVVERGASSFFIKRVLITKDTWKNIVKWVESY